MNAELALCVVRYRRTLQVNNEIWEEVVTFCLNLSQVVTKH
jgi:hypothetical protein